MRVELVIGVTTSVVAVVAWAWRNSALKRSIDDNCKRLEHHETRADQLDKRVDRLEWQSQNTDKTLAELRDGQHKLRNQVQGVQGKVELIADWVADQKRRADRHREGD